MSRGGKSEDGMFSMWVPPHLSSRDLPPRSPASGIHCGSAHSGSSDIAAEGNIGQAQKHSVTGDGGNRHRRQSALSPSSLHLSFSQQRSTPSWLYDDVADDPGDAPPKGRHRRCASDSVALFEQPSSLGDCLPPLRGRRTFASFDGDEMVDDEDFDIKNVGIAGVPVGTMDFDATRLDDDVSFMSVFDEDDKTLQLGISGVPLGNRSNGGASMGSQAGSASLAKRGGTDLMEQLKRNQSAGVSGGVSGDHQGQGSPESLSEVSNDGIEGKTDLRLGSVKAEPDVQSGSGDDEMAGGRFGSCNGNTSLDGGPSLSHATAEFLEQATADGSLDPKRAKRILANRQSAQRSRVRKLQYISELERRVTLLQGEITQLSPRVAYLDQQRLGYNNENNALKAKMAEMAQQTRYKDALNEALKKEVQKLKALEAAQIAAQLQQQQSAPTSIQSSSSPSALNGGCQSLSARYASPELSLHHNPHNISSDNSSHSLSFDAFTASLETNGLGGLGGLTGYQSQSQSSMTGLEQALAGLGSSRSSSSVGLGGLTPMQAQQLLGGGGYMVGCGSAGVSVSTGLSMSDLVMHNA